MLALQPMLFTDSTPCFQGRIEYPGMPAPRPTIAHPAFSVVTSSAQPVGARTAAKIAKCVLPEIRRASLRDTRYLLGLYGMPGSGKSTAAAAVQHVLRALAPEISTAVVSMDGWHFSRKELDGFEDSVEAHERRGAPFTFNARAFGEALERCRNRDEGVIIELPSFDHALKDPIEGDVRIDAGTDVIIVEGIISYFDYSRTQKYFNCANPLSVFSSFLPGNYLGLEGGWADARACLDYLVYLDIDIEDAMQRVHDRHVSAMGLSVEEAQLRIENNDRLNAELVMKSALLADAKISSQ